MAEKLPVKVGKTLYGAMTFRQAQVWANRHILPFALRQAGITCKVRRDNDSFRVNYAR